MGRKKGKSGGNKATVTQVELSSQVREGERIFDAISVFFEVERVDDVFEFLIAKKDVEQVPHEGDVFPNSEALEAFVRGKSKEVERAEKKKEREEGIREPSYKYLVFDYVDNKVVRQCADLEMAEQQALSYCERQAAMERNLNGGVFIYQAISGVRLTPQFAVRGCQRKEV